MSRNIRSIALPKIRLLLIAAFLCGLAATMVLTGVGGCSSIRKPYPDKKTFAFSIPKPAQEEINPQPPQATLRIRRVLISSPFDQITFVYRQGSTAYLVDYYNGFITPPAQLMTGELVKYLQVTHPVENVVDIRTSIQSQYLLEGNVSELYVDYTDPKNPQAVVSVRFFLMDDKRSETAILADLFYTRQVPLKSSDPSAVPEAFSEAYHQILQALNKDLRAAIR